jgi:hypothetical protein
MNWARGLFRLWLVGAVLYVVGIAFVAYPDVKNNFDTDKLDMIPVLCGEKRGKAGTDFTTKRGQEPGPRDENVDVAFMDRCWYPISKMRALYPEFAKLSDPVLITKTYKATGIDPDKKPWTTLFFWLGVALGVPLIILALGKSLLWAVAGFFK